MTTNGARMIRWVRLVVVIATAALLTTGCIGTAELVRALGDDPASVCASVTTINNKGAACRGR